MCGERRRAKLSREERRAPRGQGVLHGGVALRRVVVRAAVAPGGLVAERVGEVVRRRPRQVHLWWAPPLVIAIVMRYSGEVLRGPLYHLYVIKRCSQPGGARGWKGTQSTPYRLYRELTARKRRPGGSVEPP